MGDTLLVRLDHGQLSPYCPFLVTRKVPHGGTFLLTGVLSCPPFYRSAEVFLRGPVTGQIWGTPNTLTPTLYAEDLSEGDGLGQWRFR